MNNYDELKALRKQVEAEFLQEYGTGEEIEEEYVEEVKPAETIETVIADALDAYMEESVEHFLAARSRSMDEDGRYFYSDSELDDFKQRFLAANGDLKTLHIGTVYTKGEDLYPENANVPGKKFFCYEVCRKKYYDMETYYSHQQHKQNGGARLFFS